MPRFSILISVYNSEKYLDECLTSVLAQSFTDFEVIIVDDGSVDNSGKICDSFAQKDSRIRVLHTKNNGVFIARSIAEKESVGEYLLHIDSDDLTDPSLLFLIDEEIRRNNTDLIFFDFDSFFPDGKRITKTYFDSDRVFFADGKQELFRLLLTTTFNSLCHKCFNRRLIDFCPDYDEFGRLSHGEDLLRSAYLISGISSASYIKRSLYYYRREVGASVRFDPSIITDSDRVAAVICSLMNSSGFANPQNNALFCSMCRKQFNNFFRLLSNCNLKLKEKARILRFASELSVYFYAAFADGDTTFADLRIVAINKRLYRTVLIAQKIFGKD